MKKILLVVAKEKFRDEEYLETRETLEEGGVKVRVAALEGGEAIGMFGAKANIDLVVEEVNAEDFDGVAFIGGGGIVPLVNDERLIKLALDFYNTEDKLVAAICAAPGILANAGVLKDKKSTAYSGMVETIKEEGAIYEGNQIEIDGRVITADGPLSARKFGEEIVSSLK
jgi:protease I